MTPPIFELVKELNHPTQTRRGKILTELLYFHDCYLSEFKASVEGKSSRGIVLDRTAFYPAGGGQPCDTGIMNTSERSYTVEKVKKQGSDVVHILSGSGPEVGESVQCRLDWERRYSHMKYHTAQHLLSAYFLSKHGAGTVGNSRHDQGATIDFAVTKLQDSEIKAVEDRINIWIEEANPVEIFMLPREDALDRLDPRRTRIELLPKSVRSLRIVRIADIDEVACAGTHVRNTRELGCFNIEKFGQRRNGLRVEFTLA